jgi:Chromo (CHRromatin Organisation MOdifier) domain
LVKWAGFPDEYNSWEPWGNLRDTVQLEKYLAEHKMRSLLSKQKEPQAKRCRLDNADKSL